MRRNNIKNRDIRIFALVLVGWVVFFSSFFVKSPIFAILLQTFARGLP